jgi:hypothetical protein
LELSILHIFVDGVTYQGIIRFCIKKEYHNLCIELSTYKINAQSKETIEIFKNNLQSDPHNPNLINIIPAKLAIKEVFNLIECEKLVDYLGNIPVNQVGTQDYIVDFGKNLKCTISKSQVKRIFNFFNSFVTNFATLDAMYKIYINILQAKEDNKPVEEIIKEPVIDLPAKNNFKLEAPITIINNTIENQTLLEQIIDNYTLNNFVKLFTIQHIFNYLQYNSNKIKIEDNKITIVELFNSNYIFNNEYLVSILNSIVNKDLENKITFNQKKILEIIISIFDKERRESDDYLTLYTAIFLFYIYQYYFILTRHPDYEIETYLSKETQKIGIDYFIKKVSPSKEIVIDIIDNDYSDDYKVDENLVNTISDKYKHLIPISEDDFLNLAVKEYKQESNNKIQIPDFKLNNTKIININNLIQNNQAITKVLKEPINLIQQNQYDNRDGLLNYHPKIITKTYSHFKNYISNNQTVVSIKDIPKSTVSLFDFFSRNISRIYPRSENNNTFSYYKILYENLPTPKAYSHYTYLFLIFNLIIPFHYDEYKINEFVDVFL